jgi:heat shock protein HtpX
MKRIDLFDITNLAVLVLLSIIAHVLNIDTLLARQGVDMRGLLVMAAAIGFLGSFISLAMSNWSAKHLVGVHLIYTPVTQGQAWLVDAVCAHAERTGIGMPDIGFFEAPEMNAFATGARRDHALVTVSSGLLGGMTREQADAVLGHEMTHVANGDARAGSGCGQHVRDLPVTCLQHAARQCAGRLARQPTSGPGPFYFVFVIVLQVALVIPANIVVMWFSRQREFRADAGGAKLASTGNMIAALERLDAQQGAALPGQMAAFGISGEATGGLRRLFMSHPPIAERIAALRVNQYA